MADKTWLGDNATIGYDSGSDEPTAGDILTGTTSAAFAIFVSATVAGGSWVGNDASGVLTLKSVSGTFLEDEVIINTTTGDTDIADIHIAGSAYVDNAGDFNIAANWSPSGVPADGDDLFFNGLADTVPVGFADSTNHTEGKKYSVTDTLDQSAKDFPTIIVSENYDGNIGYGFDSEVPPVYHALRCAADSVVFEGSGEFHLVSQHATEDLDSVVSSSSNGTMYLGKSDTNGQAIIDVVNSGNVINILTAATDTLAAPEVDNIVCASRRGSVNVPEDNSSATLLIRSILGTVNCNCSTAEVQVAGGSFNWGAADFAPAAARTITKMLLFQGNVNWDMAGTISELICYDGKFSLSGSGVKVLGDSTKNNGTIEIYNAAVSLVGASNNISLAADSEVKVLGGGSFSAPKFTDIVFTN